MSERPGSPGDLLDSVGLAPQERTELEQLAVALAEEAGAFIRDERPDTLGVAQTKSTDLDVVTEMDTACEQLLRDRIATRRPADAILGEEGGLVTGDGDEAARLTWVLDPIDGTVNYLYDLPAYAVSVAVVVGDPTTPGAWAPVAGAVINPRTDEIFHACAGGGARLTSGGRTTQLALLPDHGTGLAGALLATGFAYDRDVRREQAAVVADLLPRVRDIRRLGAAALDLCHVATGRVDGYWEVGTHVWDVAAGMLVVTECGGVVSGPQPGSPVSTELVLAARPVLHGLLAEDLAALIGGSESP